MQAIFDVPAPAKLNLFLHVVGRREDGLHLLQSVFMLIDWCDTLHFERRGGGVLEREDLTVALPEDDLVLRAARALREHVGRPELGAHIAIDKRIPAEAGMGGGSSDAASCLLALNRLWQLDLPVATLARIGLALGADVPFFLGGGNAWVEGVGERLTPVAVPAGRFLVVKPDQGLETRAIFTSPLLKRDRAPAILAGFAANPFGFGHNDLQPVAEALCPAVRQSIDWLAARGLPGRMTGSGSAVFAALAGFANEARSWQNPPVSSGAQPAPAGWQVRECGNLEVHPLAGWASRDESR